jgi:hypothetical protein
MGITNGETGLCDAGPFLKGKEKPRRASVTNLPIKGLKGVDSGL